MSLAALHTRLGIFALGAALFLAFYAIPNWVSSPSNVRNIVLAPTFWPYTLSGILALIGIGLLFFPESDTEAEADVEEAVEQSVAPWLRLLVMFVIMVVTMIGLPRLGMVWTSMLTFILTAFMFKTRYPLAAVICALIIPLVLYAFFAHIAGVAIPQGDYVRLP